MAPPPAGMPPDVRPPPLLVAAAIGLLVTSIVSAFAMPLRPQFPTRAELTTNGARLGTTTTVGLGLATTTSSLLPIAPDLESTSTSSIPPPIDMSRSTPPASGFYRYLLVLDEEEEDIAKVEYRGAASALDVTDHDDGSVDHWRWSRDSVIVHSTTLGLEPDDERCSWQPALTLYKFPMTAGTSWSNDSRCTASNGDGSVTIHVVTKSAVLRAETITVAREPVETWVIDHMVSVEIHGQADGEEFTSRSEERQTEHFSPRHGLEVSVDIKRRQVDNSPEGEDSYEEFERRALLSLEPAPR